MSSINSLQNIKISLSVNDTGTAIEDLNDQCMRSVISSFEITDAKVSCGLHVGGNRIIFHLKPLDLVEVKYLKSDGTEVKGPRNKITFAVTCTAQSVIKLLHASGCVGKDVVCFQWRTGSLMDDRLDVSELIPLTHDGRPASGVTLDFKNGIVSHTYAYLEDRQLCVFLNDPKPDTLKKIDDLLTNHFSRA